MYFLNKRAGALAFTQNYNQLVPTVAVNVRIAELRQEREFTVCLPGETLCFAVYGKRHVRKHSLVQEGCRQPCPAVIQIGKDCAPALSVRLLRFGICLLYTSPSPR